MKEPYEKGLASRSAPTPTPLTVTSWVWHGPGVHAGQLLSSEIITFACRPCPDMGKATRSPTLWRVDGRRGGVLDPVHVWKLQTREPGDPMGFRTATWHMPRGGTVGEGPWPYVRHARPWEVRWSHSTREAGEQNQNAGSGACGGKGTTRGKWRNDCACAGHRAGSASEFTDGASTARKDGSISTVEPKGRAV